MAQPGSRLDDSIRAKWEARLGVDFSNVRIHSDSAAARSSAAIFADAWAVGNHVAFGERQFAPGTATGDQLLGHELSHVAQQRAAGPSEIASALARPIDVDLGAEAAADAPPRGIVAQRPTAIMRQRHPIGRISDVDVSCATNEITFHGSSGSTAYRLAQCDVTDGTYDAGVVISGRDVRFNLGDQAVEGRRFNFDYEVGDGQVSPNELLAGQPRVQVRAHAAPVSDSGGDSLAFNVRVMSASGYEAATGTRVADLPEGRPAVPGAGFGGLRAPLPFPPNTSGILVSPGHVSDLVAAGGDLTVLGFRAGFPTHVRAWVERGVGQTGGDANYLLNAGKAPARYANDFFYPHLPGTRLVHRGALDPADMGNEAGWLRRRAGAYSDVPYTHSAPPPGSPAEVRLLREGAICGPGQNCVTVPVPEHSRVLPEVNPAEFAEGAHPHGAIRNAREWATDTEGLAARGLSSTPTSLGMNLRFVLKSGGYVLLIYGAYSTTQRITQAPTGTGAVVVGEETGSWVGGWAGSAVAPALGAWVGRVLADAGLGLLVCSETGPGAVLCGAAAAIVGGIGGGYVGSQVGHSVGEQAQDVVNLVRDPAALLRTSDRMFGTPESHRALRELRDFEGAEPDPLDEDYLFGP